MAVLPKDVIRCVVERKEIDPRLMSVKLRVGRGKCMFVRVRIGRRRLRYFGKNFQMA